LVTLLAQAESGGPARGFVELGPTGCINLGPVSRETLAVDDSFLESIATRTDPESVRTLKEERCSASVK